MQSQRQEGFLNLLADVVKKIGFGVERFVPVFMSLSVSLANLPVSVMYADKPPSLLRFLVAAPRRNPRRPRLKNRYTDLGYHDLLPLLHHIRRPTAGGGLRRGLFFGRSPGVTATTFRCDHHSPDHGSPLPLSNGVSVSTTIGGDRTTTIRMPFQTCTSRPISFR